MAPMPARWLLFALLTFGMGTGVSGEDSTHPSGGGAPNLFDRSPRDGTLAATNRRLDAPSYAVLGILIMSMSTTPAADFGRLENMTKTAVADSAFVDPSFIAMSVTSMARSPSTMTVRADYTIKVPATVIADDVVGNLDLGTVMIHLNRDLKALGSPPALLLAYMPAMACPLLFCPSFPKLPPPPEAAADSGGAPTTANVGLIVGLAVGGVIFLLLVVLGYCVIRSKCSDKSVDRSKASPPAEAQTAPFRLEPPSPINTTPQAKTVDVELGGTPGQDLEEGGAPALTAPSGVVWGRPVSFSAPPPVICGSPTMALATERI